MKYVLWIVQILLALAFVASGFIKLTMPVEQLAQNMVWVTAVPVWLLRLIGLAEVAGAFGLILPTLTRSQPQLTPLAAACLAVDMLFAAIFHLTRGETGFIAPNLVLLLLAAFVAYGRWQLLPVAPRTAQFRATAAAR